MFWNEIWSTSSICSSYVFATYISSRTTPSPHTCGIITFIVTSNFFLVTHVVLEIPAKGVLEWNKSSAADFTCFWNLVLIQNYCFSFFPHIWFICSKTFFWLSRLKHFLVVLLGLNWIELNYSCRFLSFFCTCVAYNMQFLLKRLFFCASNFLSCL